ncbi:hypothetical protein PCANB_001711 [Pneumocystis canis]|nr:hypothetical protein PCANB_001711 [Pneumocystis canis]
MIYYAKRSVCLGELYRYTITLESSFEEFQKASKNAYKILWLRIRNTTPYLFRAAYFNGPYSLYVSVRSLDYSPFKSSFDFIPQYKSNLNAGSSFWVALPIISNDNSNSCLNTTCLSKKKGWIVDIISQVVFSQSSKVHFEIALSTSIQHILWVGCFGVVEFKNIPIKIFEQDTQQLWSIPKFIKTDDSVDKSLKKDIHFVVLTHGLHSNVNADLFYLKEQIEKQGRASGENLIISGYSGNVCKMDKGIEYLGKRLAEWVLKEVGWSKDKKSCYQKISFISHSLGGLVQLYAIGWIWMQTEGKFFDSFSNGLIPVNFITLASPWLGLFAENPLYLTKALEYGIVGKTGKDLGLSIKHNKSDSLTNQTIQSDSPLPFLRTLSSERSPFKAALKLFQKRTLYSNIINDGIVPLRTSSLLFLDWKSVNWFEKEDDLNEYKMNALYSTQADRVTRNYSYEQKNNDDSMSTDYSSKTTSTMPFNESMQTGISDISSILPPKELNFLDIDKSKSNRIENIALNTSKNMKSKDETEFSANIPQDTDKFHISEYNCSSFISKTNPQPSHLNPKPLDTSMSCDYNSLKSSQNNHNFSFLETKKIKTNYLSYVISLLKTHLKIKHNEDDLKIKKSKRSLTINSTSTDYIYFCHKINLIPKMGFFQSARNVLNSPLPEKEYLINPPQKKTIVHDRYYYPEDIPKKSYKMYSKLATSVENKKDNLKKSKIFEEKLDVEEKIAREWHTDIIWRKVLVYLEPDAHNNIICRRMFVNAYGWPVIEHLVVNHFGEKS